MGHFGLAGWLAGHLLQNRPFFIGKTAFLESKRALSSVFWTFFDLRTSLAEPDPNKTGLNTILVVGGSLDVIESTSLSSPTGFPDPPDPPKPPPDPSQEVLDKILIFSIFFLPSRRRLATCSPSPAAASRQRGTASNAKTTS